MILMAAVVKSVVGVGFRNQHWEMMAILKIVEESSRLL